MKTHNDITTPSPNNDVTTPITIKIENKGESIERVFIFDESFKNKNIEISYTNSDKDLAETILSEIKNNGIVFGMIYVQSSNELQINGEMYIRDKKSNAIIETISLVLDPIQIMKTVCLRKKEMLFNHERILHFRVQPKTIMNIFLYPKKK